MVAYHALDFLAGGGLKNISARVGCRGGFGGASGLAAGGAFDPDAAAGLRFLAALGAGTFFWPSNLAMTDFNVASMSGWSEAELIKASMPSTCNLHSWF